MDVLLPSRTSNPTIQRFVLAEYIKASQVDTEQLVAFIKTYNLQADWFSMQLPGGKAPSQMLDSLGDPQHNNHLHRPKYAPVHARGVDHAGYRP